MSSIFGNTIIILVAFIVLFAFIALFYRDKYYKMKDEFLDLADIKGFFTKRLAFIRQDEREFFDILTKLYGDKYYIFPQVHLSSLLDIKNDVKDHDNLYREIDHRSVDYVLFDRVTLSPLLAIELNGSSHFLMTRKNRDQKISNILLRAGIQFIAFSVTKSYDEGILQKQINPLLTATS